MKSSKCRFVLKKSIKRPELSQFQILEALMTRFYNRDHRVKVGYKNILRKIKKMFVCFPFSVFKIPVILT